MDRIYHNSDLHVIKTFHALRKPLSIQGISKLCPVDASAVEEL